MAANDTTWISAARAVLQESNVDFFRVSPARYWGDFLLSLTLGYGAGTIFLAAPLGSLVQLAAYPLAVFWLYRLGSLVHEVCHLSHREMRVFKVAWNLMVGVVTLAPSPFFTRHHRDHHSQRLYGTRQDPEYIVNVFRPGSLLSLMAYALHVALFPLVVFLRFLFAPLSFLHPRLRAWVLKHASSLTMNYRYERKLNRFDRWAVTTIELLCWLRATAMLAAVAWGATHWTRLPLFYSLAMGVLVLNQLRLLADHHFEADGERFELDEHIRDSCNFTGQDFLTWLLFPFAIRYHALHTRTWSSGSRPIRRIAHSINRAGGPWRRKRSSRRPTPQWSSIPRGETRHSPPATITIGTDRQGTSCVGLRHRHRQYWRGTPRPPTRQARAREPRPHSKRLGPTRCR
jgi:Fatty acid desaturase